MTNNNEMIEWFRSSSTYINAHRNKIFVVLLSGETLASDNLPNIIYDLNLLHSLGVKLVLVHGSRPQITSALAAAGKTSSYHRKRRITEADSMATIKNVIGGLSIDLEAMFSMGLRNSPMQGTDIRVCRGNFVTAKPLGIHDGVDFHYTGKVRKIHTRAIEQQLSQNNIVLLSNLGYSRTGEVFNLTVEEVATQAAIALQAEKLILFIPGDSVLDSNGNQVTILTPADAQTRATELAQHDDSDSVCISHALDAAVQACANNVHRSHLISFEKNGALLQELFTREGNGCLVSTDKFDELVDATIDDVVGIIELIKPLEQEGTLVERSRELLETEIGNFKIVKLEGTVIACAALYPFADKRGELACIAIHPQYQKNGYGDRLLVSLEQKARELGLDTLFVLTTVTAHWFLEKGFVEGSLSDLPEKKQQLYNYQRKSKVLFKPL